jgi:protein-S-isoprenylcysteine O-methyltransferase Ste14
MHEYIKFGLKLTWIVVLTYWVISGAKAKRPRRQESVLTRFIQYWLPLLAAFLLLGPGEWFGHSWLRENFVPHNNLVGISGLSVSIIGAVVACRSRYILGKNWSLAVQKKEGHELIQHGIYNYIRHPIYSGLLLIFTGHTLIVGDYRGIIALGIVFVSFRMKLMKEEKWLIEIFGDQYTAYKSRTKALIPYLL